MRRQKIYTSKLTLDVRKSRNKILSWLRDSHGVLNYSRVIGFLLLLILQPLILLHFFVKVGMSKMENIYQWMTVCIPSVVAVLLLLIDLFRDKNSMKFKIGDNEFEINKDDTKNSDGDLPVYKE